jgi:hypothetical protein
MTPPAGQKEAFSRVVIDAQLADVGWNLADGQSVRYEFDCRVAQPRHQFRYGPNFSSSHIQRLS